MHSAKKLRNSKAAETLFGPGAIATIQLPAQALLRMASVKNNP